MPTSLILLFAQVSLYGYAFFIIIYSLTVIYSSSTRSVWSKWNTFHCVFLWTWIIWPLQVSVVYFFTMSVANNEESCGRGKNILNIPLTTLKWSYLIFLFKHLWLNWSKQQVVWPSLIWIKNCRVGKGLHKSCLSRALNLSIHQKQFLINCFMI